VFGVDKMATNGVPEVSTIVLNQICAQHDQTVPALVPLMHVRLN
jgi:hypothetical protein